MMKAALLLVALCLASAHAVHFSGNISFNGNNNGWDFRETGLLVLPRAVFYSSNIVEKNNTAGTFNVSGIFGAGVFPITPNVPYAFAVSYDADSSWRTPGEAWIAANVDASLNYIVNAYLRINEYAPNGTVVASHTLRSSSYFFRGMKWKADYVYETDELSTASYVGKPSDGGNWYINITFIASSVVGVVDLANAVVGPSTFEQIVQINNWPYLDQDNYLELVVCTVTGERSTSSGAYISSGSGADQVYFQAAEQAIVDGSSVPVSISTSTSSQADIDVIKSNIILRAQIASKFSSATYTTVSVKFPAGAKEIAYDPAIGAGQPLPFYNSEKTSTASTSVVSFSILVLALLALFL